MARPAEDVEHELVGRARAADSLLTAIEIEEGESEEEESSIPGVESEGAPEPQARTGELTPE